MDQYKPTFLDRVNAGFGNPMTQFGLNLLAGSMQGDPGRGVSTGAQAAGRAQHLQFQQAQDIAAEQERRRQAGAAQAEKAQQEKLFLEAISGADPKTRPILQMLGPQKAGEFLLKRLQGPDPLNALDRARLAKLQAETKKLSREGTEKPIPGGFKDPKQLYDVESGYRKEFKSLTGDFRDTATAYEKVKISSKNPSAAGDLALIFNYMKMLDPGSVVREGEFATAQNAAGIPQRIVNTYNRLLNGERLSESQRVDFANQAENVFSAARVNYDSQLKRMRGIAAGSGINPERAIPDFYPQPNDDPRIQQLKKEVQEEIDQGADPDAVKQRIQKEAQEAIDRGAYPDAVKQRIQQLSGGQ